MIKKLFNKKSKKKAELPSRITNDTVAEHRERVLAGGRKLKYPVQYTRSALVRNTIIISVVALLLLLGAVWLQLYIVKDTSDIAYRITRATRVPVAKIDNEFVPYSDYLLYYRASMAHIKNQTQSSGDMPWDKLNFQQEQAMEKALRDAYARKLARENNITISDKKIDDLIDKARKASGLSEKAYAAATKDNLNWTMDEMKLALKNDLLRQEVSFSVDKEAQKTAKEISDLATGGLSLADIAQKMGNRVSYVQDVVVPAGNADGGLSEEVGKLQVGETSAPIKTTATDGYYIALRQQADSGQISYSYIKVPLTVFDSNFKKLRQSDKTRLYIKLDKQGE